MKVLLSFIFFIISINLFANDSSSENNPIPEENNKRNKTKETDPKDYKRKPVDLIFFTNPHKTTIAAEFVSFTSESNQENSSTRISDHEENRYEINYTAAYGIDDYWGVSLLINQLISSTNTTSPYPVGQKQEYKSSGIGDPTLSVGYSVLDMSTDKYDMNVSLAFSPEILDAKNASTSKDGNNGNGENILTAKVKWGKRINPFSWMVSFTLNKYYTMKSENAEDGSIVERTPYSNYSLGGGFQWQVSQQTSIDLNFGFSAIGERDLKTSTTTATYESNSSFSIGSKINILMLKDFYLTFSLGLLTFGDQNIIFQSGSKVTMKKTSTKSLSIGLILEI